MAYEKMEAGAENILYIYILISIVSIYMSFMMFKKWNERKTLPTKLMFFTFLGYTIAIFGLFVGFIEMISTGEKREIYKFSLAFAYTLIMLTNVLLLKFAEEIFSIESKLINIFIIISIIIAVLVALPLNFYGVPEQDVTNKWFRPITSILMVLFSIIVYSKIASSAFQNARKIENPLAKAGFRWIGFSQICMILFIGFLAADTVYFTLTSGSGYTVFVYFAWIFAGLFFVFCYMGLIMPDWLKKRYSN